MHKTIIKMSKRVALCIGIDYTGSNIALNECINDCNKMSLHLRALGYTVKTLTDKDSPTKARIIQELIAIRGDDIVISYSGHGTQVRDTSGDERDGKDECIVPIDYTRSGFISDDYILAIMRMKRGSSIKLIFDCCHSGTMCDLYHNINYKREISIENRGYRTRLRDDPKIVCLSACIDSQVAYEVSTGGILTSYILSMPKNVSLRDMIAGTLRFYATQRATLGLSGTFELSGEFFALLK